MNQPEFLHSIKSTYEKGLVLIEKKNKDYANSDNPFKNFEMSETAGVPVERAILVRVLDKISRISTLLDNEAAVVDEKIEDTILDAINYLAILKAYREGCE